MGIIQLGKSIVKLSHLLTVWSHITLLEKKLKKLKLQIVASIFNCIILYNEHIIKNYISKTMPLILPTENI